MYLKINALGDYKKKYDPFARLLALKRGVGVCSVVGVVSGFYGTCTWNVRIILCLFMCCDACVAIVTPHAKCRLRLLKLERIKDYLLMEEEFIRNQERLKPQDEKNEVGSFAFYSEMPVPGERI